MDDETIVLIKTMPDGHAVVEYDDGGTIRRREFLANRKGVVKEVDCAFGIFGHMKVGAGLKRGGTALRSSCDKLEATILNEWAGGAGCD